MRPVGASSGSCEVTTTSRPDLKWGRRRVEAHWLGCAPFHTAFKHLPASLSRMKATAVNPVTRMQLTSPETRCGGRKWL